MMWSVGRSVGCGGTTAATARSSKGASCSGSPASSTTPRRGRTTCGPATTTRPGAASPSPTARPGPGAGHESTYLYAGGSPLSMVEPTGLRAAKEESVRQQNEAIFAAERAEDMSVMDRVDAWADSLSLLEGAEILAGVHAPRGGLDAGRAPSSPPCRASGGRRPSTPSPPSPAWARPSRAPSWPGPPGTWTRWPTPVAPLTRNGDEIADRGKVVRRADPDFPTVRPRGIGVRTSHNRSGRTDLGADDPLVPPRARLHRPPRRWSADAGFPWPERPGPARRRAHYVLGIVDPWQSGPG